MGQSTYTVPMRFTRHTRRWLSGWLIGALLCMQWAMAAYACPQLLAGSIQQTSMAMADMPDCPGMSHAQMDPAAPWLCKAHCNPGSHATQPSTPDVSVDQVAPVLLGWLDWRPVAQMVPGSSDDRVSAAATGPPPGWPPIYLSLQVLRN
jgi:hypothetical protein